MLDRRQFLTRTLQGTSLLAFVPDRPGFKWSKPTAHNYIDELVFARLPILLGFVMEDAAAFTGVFATVLAFTIQLRAQRFTSATHTALIFSTEPVFGAIFAYLLVGEVLAPAAIFGCGLILAGMLVAQLAE